MKGRRKKTCPILTIECRYEGRVVFVHACLLVAALCYISLNLRNKILVGDDSKISQLLSCLD